MEYKITIVEASHLVLNIEEDNLYGKCGGNLLGALVIKTDDFDSKFPKTQSMHDKFVSENYYNMLHASVCFKKKDIQGFLTKHSPGFKITSEKCYIDFENHKGMLNRFTGKELLVKEVKVFDWRDDSDEEVYDPDDWEYVLKVKEIC